MFYDFSTWADVAGGQCIDLLGLDVPRLILLLAGILVVFFVSRAGKDTPVAFRLSSRPVLWSVTAAALVLVILVFGSYGMGYNAGDFIYGQF
jgi:hypothetical protein